MAFPTSSVNLGQALETVTNVASATRARVQALRDESALGNTDRDKFVRLQAQLNQAITRWDNVASTSGLAAYAREQYDDPTLDIAAEYTAMRAAAVSLRDWIFNNLPTDPSGAVLLFQLEQDGSLTPLTVSPAATAGFRTEADAFLATVE